MFAALIEVYIYVRFLCKKVCIIGVNAGAPRTVGTRPDGPPYSKTEDTTRRAMNVH